MHPKRQGAFEKAVSERQPSSSSRKLKDMCRIRWLQRIDARGLLAITTTDFVSTLVITNSCLKYLKALTASLQAEAKDIVAAVSEIDTVTATVQNVRDNIDTHHSQWFLTITEMLSEVGIEPSVPRRCGRQTQRSNVPADTPSEYFRRTISIPVLDHLFCELRSRFGKHQ